MHRQPLYDFGGAGPVINLALANGFPPQTYQPMLQPLTAHYRVVSLLPRALWPQIGPPPTQIGTWRELTDDLLAGLRQHELENVIAVGHSFGAIAALLAVLAEPERFRALVLLDPAILPLPVMQSLQAARAQGKVPLIPLAVGALNRRQHFPDVEEAYAYWRGKPLFHDWSDEAVRRYAESLTRPTANGGLELSWPRAWEAYYYQSIYPDTWNDLPDLNGLRPTLIIRGGASDTYVKRAAQDVQAILPEATHMNLSGYGHLFPLAAPDATRAMIENWLQTL